MIHIVWVTNIPTPYRNHRYERMAALFPALGLSFEVHFMAWTESNRPWVYTSSDLHYPHRVHRGVNLEWVADPFHVNPGLVWWLARHPSDVLVVGGWASPNAFSAPWVVPSRTLRLLESESNPSSSRYIAGPARWLKGAAVRRYHGYIGPGRRSRELLALLDPTSAERPFLEFPNLIDKGVFGDGTTAARARRTELRRALAIPDETQLWVCPARLEPYKGLHLLLPLLRGLERIRLDVCGEGTQRAELQAMIDAQNLPVRLVGQRSEAEMVELYAAADLFVLPSINDASPLSAIEACAAGLPVFVSRRVGNFEDVVDDDNGWGFDADRPESNRELIARIAATPLDRLAAMGRRSREIYDRRFDSDMCVRRLGEGIRDLHARQAREA